MWRGGSACPGLPARDYDWIRGRIGGRGRRRKNFYNLFPYAYGETYSSKTTIRYFDKYPPHPPQH
jgi:hypothetical protein